MPKFRKKPVVVEAEQFFRDKLPFIPGMLMWQNSGQHYVITPEGPLNISDGDWIITGTKGETYPCKPDVFAETYELVDD